MKTVATLIVLLIGIFFSGFAYFMSCMYVDARRGRMEFISDVRRRLEPMTGPLPPLRWCPFAPLTWSARRSEVPPLPADTSDMFFPTTIPEANRLWSFFYGIEAVVCDGAVPSLMPESVDDAVDLLRALSYVKERRYVWDPLDPEVPRIATRVLELVWKALRVCACNVFSRMGKYPAWSTGMDRLVAGLKSRRAPTRGESLAAISARRAWEASPLLIDASTESVDDALAGALEMAPMHLVGTARANAARLVVWCLEHNVMPDAGLVAGALSRRAAACRELGRSLLVFIDSAEPARLVAGIEVLAALESGHRSCALCPVQPPSVTAAHQVDKCDGCFRCGADAAGVHFVCSKGHRVVWCVGCERAVRRGAKGAKFMTSSTPCLLGSCGGVCIDAGRVVKGVMRSIVAQ